MSNPATNWAAAFRSPVGACSAGLIVCVGLLAVFAPLVWEEDASAVDTNAIQQGPSSTHWLGTDALGRDVFFRILVATRLSIELPLLATIIGVSIGTVLGALPSVLPRILSRVLTAGVEIAVAFPGLQLALFFAVIFGVGRRGAVLAIAFAMVPQFARLTQTMAASVAGRDYVAAARVAGVGKLRLVFRHILPNIGDTLVVNATVSAGAALLAFTGLSFLGLGLQAPMYDWGRLLGEGLLGIYTNPAAALAPGVAVVIAGLAFNLFGETASAVIGVRTATKYVGAPPVPATPSRDAEPPDDASVLEVRDLRVSFLADQQWVTPVRGVSFTVTPGEAVGVVGESGSGKSLTVLAAAQLVEEPAVVTADRLEFDGTSLLDASSRELRTTLGTSLAMVFQDPMTSFNPARRVGRQLAEVAEQHQGLGKRPALARAVDRLRAVRVPAADRRAQQFPHEFSGGMRQRAMVGMGLMGNPRLIIADEPTTALDVTVQRQVLRLLADVREREDTAILLISHDITVVSQTCERILVMYAGRIVEDLPSSDLLTSAQHPYTRALLDAVPDMDSDRRLPLTVIPGQPPDPGELPRGCAFAPRCGFATPRCGAEDPVLGPLRGTHRISCWNPQGRPESTVAAGAGQPEERAAAHE